MKKLNWKKFLLTGILMLVCSVYAVAKDKKFPVERGMTQQEVMEILGNPLTRSFDEYTERWDYLKKQGNLLYRREVHLVVEFDRNGRVLRFQTIDPFASSETTHTRVAPLPRYDEYYGRDCLSMDYPLSEDEFSRLYEIVKKNSFDDRKLNLIEVASIRSSYTCSQCAELIQLFSFSDNRLKALRLMEHRIVDTRDMHSILRLFSFSSEKEEATRIILGR